MVCFLSLDWTGKNRRKLKRGFKTRKEALEWEQKFRLQQATNLDMDFGSFYRIYEDDLKPKLKLNTWKTKDTIFRNRILPYFKDKKMNEISPADIIKWQNAIMKLKTPDGKPFKPTYLKTIQSELSAPFNHAIRFYNLPDNPVKKAGTIGKGKADEMEFWTEEEYLKFIEQVKDKSYQRIDGEDIITDPKTPKSRRDIVMPDFLAEEMKEYLSSLYGFTRDNRIFMITKSYLHKEMTRGAKKAGVKRITIHGLRHSHISYLINRGFSAVAIGNRVGHESQSITFHYAHMFPTEQQEMAAVLNREFCERTGSLEKGDDGI